MCQFQSLGYLLKKEMKCFHLERVFWFVLFLPPFSILSKIPFCYVCFPTNVMSFYVFTTLISAKLSATTKAVKSLAMLLIPNISWLFFYVLVLTLYLECNYCFHSEGNGLDSFSKQWAPTIKQSKHQLSFRIRGTGKQLFLWLWNAYLCKLKRFYRLLKTKFIF